MYFRTTYDCDFDDLYMHLRAKYPDKLFDLDGIGKQLDMSSFSRNFFASNVTADASIDANANCDDVSVIAYNTEMPKPFFRLNSYYILWKELKRLYGSETANTIVEMQLVGDIYIHDFHGIAAGIPYSYHPKTTMAIKDGEGNLVYTTMEELYDKLSVNHKVISCDFNSDIISLEGYKILDDQNHWVDLIKVLRHKPHNELIGLETKNGRCTIVTADHPVILDSGQKKAYEVIVGDRLRMSNTTITFGEEIVSDEYAYFVGFMIGDGMMSITKEKATPIRRASFSIRQNDIVNTKIYSVANSLFSNVRVAKNGTEIKFGNKEEVEKLIATGILSQNRKLNYNVLNWNPRAVKNLIAGIIDSDANINTNGVCTIRVTSFALVQQLGDIFRALNIGETRTSFVDEYQGKNSYKSNYPLYRLSCRVKDLEIAHYSVKISDSSAIVYKDVQKDGRYEQDDNRVHKIVKVTSPRYVYDVTTSSGHFYSQGMVQHNCFNYSTYDIMTKGLPMVKKVKSLPPKYLYAFKSQLEQFTVVASNSTLGATGLADLLVVMSYYVSNILKTHSDAHFKFADEQACWKYIKENLVSFIYTINQPMRANQSPFTNVSVYDDNFLDKLCEDYLFPDGSTPDKAVIKRLQRLYLDIMNEELKRTPLTFPVTTACFSIDSDHNILDENFLSMISEKNQEFGFINIYCGDSSTLSSCCRLRSEQQSEYFNSFGSGSSKIGSLGVCSINFPRLAIKYPDKSDFMEKLTYMVGICAKINNAKRHIVEKRIKNGNEPLYTLGFMELSKQYSTVGVNGFYECIKYLGEDILEESGQELALEIIGTINAVNKKYQRQYDAPHNCEQVPGENMSIKMADKDKLLGYQNEYDIYSNQFIPLIVNADMLDRVRLQGLFDSHFSGGAICHLNVDSQISNVDDIKELIRVTAKMGVVYHAINYNLQECEMGHMSVGKSNVCQVCGKRIVNNYTRVVGFLTNVKNWHEVRRKEDYPERQFYHGVKM